MTIQQAAHDAIACQDGCNASGIAHSMLDAMAAIRSEGTRAVNTHPIVYLFLYKLMALNGHEPMDDHYHIAEKHCEAIAEGVSA